MSTNVSSKKRSAAEEPTPLAEDLNDKKLKSSSSSTTLGRHVSELKEGDSDTFFKVASIMTRAVFKSQSELGLLEKIAFAASHRTVMDEGINLYASFRQANRGDRSEDKPMPSRWLNPQGAAFEGAWAALKGTDQPTAQKNFLESFVALVEKDEEFVRELCCNKAGLNIEALRTEAEQPTASTL